MEYTIDQLPNVILDIVSDKEEQLIKIIDIYDSINKYCPKFNKYSDYDNQKFKNCVVNINDTYKFIHFVNGRYPSLVYSKKTSNDISKIYSKNNDINDEISSNYLNKIIIDRNKLSDDYENLNKIYSSIQNKLQKIENDKKLFIDVDKIDDKKIDKLKQDMEYYKTINDDANKRIRDLENNLENYRNHTCEKILYEIKKCSLVFLGGCFTTYLMSNFYF